MFLSTFQPYAFALYIWIYCIVWWWIQDAFKVATYVLIKRYNWFNYNDTGKVMLPESTVNYIATHKDEDMKNSVKVGHH